MSTSLYEHWRPFRDAFNPQLNGLPLEDMEALYVAPPLAPPLHAFTQRVAEWEQDTQSGRWGAAPPRLLLVGARGSGKSTQLHRAATLLPKTTTYPVLVDVSPALVDGMGTLPLLIHAGLAGLAHLTERAAHGDAAEGMEAIRVAAGEATGALATAMQALSTGASFADGVGDLLAAAGVVLTQVPTLETQVGAAGAAAGAIAGKAMGSGFRGIRRAITALKGVGADPNLAAALGQNAVQQAKPMLDAVNQVFDALHKATGRRPVLLLEGMDKAASVDDAFALVRDDKLFAELGFPTALTGSIALNMKLEWKNHSDVFTLETAYTQATRAFEATETLRADTLAFFQSLVKQRSVHYGVPEGIISSEQLRSLATASSGLTAEFIKLLDDAGTFARTAQARTIRDEDVEQAIFRLRNALETPLTDAHWSILKAVMESKKAPNPSGPEGPLGQDLLYRNYILCYRNGRPWYWPHEALLPLPNQQTPAAGDDGAR